MTAGAPQFSGRVARHLPLRSPGAHETRLPDQPYPAHRHDHPRPSDHDVRSSRLSLPERENSRVLQDPHPEQLHTRVLSGSSPEEMSVCSVLYSKWVDHTVRTLIIQHCQVKGDGGGGVCLARKWELYHRSTQKYVDAYLTISKRFGKTLERMLILHIQDSPVWPPTEPNLIHFNLLAIPDRVCSTV